MGCTRYMRAHAHFGGALLYPFPGRTCLFASLAPCTSGTAEARNEERLLRKSIVVLLWV